MLSKQLADNLLYNYGRARHRFPLIFKRPFGFFFYLTGRCNLKCNFCWQREDDYRKMDWENTATNELRVEEWIRIIRKIPRFSFIGLSGGEATISNAFGPIVKEAAQRKIPVTVNTNGTLIKTEHVRLLTETSVKNVSVSLDGFSEVHDKGRGISGLFDRIMVFIENLNKHRRMVHKPSLTIKTVLSEKNIKQLPLFREFCEKKLYADTLNISFMKTGDHAQFSLKYCNSITEIFRKKHSILFSYKRTEEIVNTLSKLLEDNARSKCKVQLYPQMTKQFQIRNFLRKKGKDIYQPCFLPWSLTVVLPDGEVVPCLSFGLGNLKNNGYDIKKFYKNNKYVSFQKIISNAGTKLPDACNVCCFLRVANA